jgi:DNA repair protein RecO (recombination protein O)
MEWSDHGVIIAINKYSEESAIVSCLMQKRGLCRGFIKNIHSKTFGKSIFIGNIVHISWSARLEKHLGSWKILSYETLAPFFYHDNKKLTAVGSICAIINTLLAEQEPHEELFNELIRFLYSIKLDNYWLKELIFLELSLLSDIGYGLDLSTCAVTGISSDLIYISPNTGKAVCSEAGKQYHSRLFLLPKFLIDSSIKQPTHQDLLYVLRITKHFFEKFISSQKNLAIPKIRIMLENVL